MIAEKGAAMIKGTARQRLAAQGGKAEAHSADIALPDGGLRCAHPPYACCIIIEREMRRDRPQDPTLSRNRLGLRADSDQSAQF